MYSKWFGVYVHFGFKQKMFFELQCITCVRGFAVMYMLVLGCPFTLDLGLSHLTFWKSFHSLDGPHTGVEAPVGRISRSLARAIVLEKFSMDSLLVLGEMSPFVTGMSLALDLGAGRGCTGMSRIWMPASS